MRQYFPAVVRALAAITLGYVLGCVALIPHKLDRLAERQSQATSAYLCIEAMKLKIKSAHCDRIVEARP